MDPDLERYLEGKAWGDAFVPLSELWQETHTLVATSRDSLRHALVFSGCYPPDPRAGGARPFDDAKARLEKAEEWRDQALVRATLSRLSAAAANGDFDIFAPDVCGRRPITEAVTTASPAPRAVSRRKRTHAGRLHRPKIWIDGVWPAGIALPDQVAREDPVQLFTTRRGAREVRRSLDGGNIYFPPEYPDPLDLPAAKALIEDALARDGDLTQPQGVQLLTLRDPNFPRWLARDVVAAVTGHTKTGPRGPRRPRGN